MLMIYKPVRWALPDRAAPAIEPVTDALQLEHSGIDDYDDPASVSLAVSSARRWIEGFTHRALITQIATYKLDKFPDHQESIIELPGGNLQSVTSIQYVDTAGATQTWASSNYDVDTDHVPGRLALAFEKTWPSVREWNLPVTITYVVGYGDAAADVPDELKHAIKMIAADLLENPEPTIVGESVALVPWRPELLASPYRIIKL